MFSSVDQIMSSVGSHSEEGGFVNFYDNLYFLPGSVACSVGPPHAVYARTQSGRTVPASRRLPATPAHGDTLLISNAFRRVPTLSHHYQNARCQPTLFAGHITTNCTVSRARMVNSQVN